MSLEAYNGLLPPPLVVDSVSHHFLHQAGRALHPPQVSETMIRQQSSKQSKFLLNVQHFTIQISHVGRMNILGSYTASPQCLHHASCFCRKWVATDTQQPALDCHRSAILPFKGPLHDTNSHGDRSWRLCSALVLSPPL